MKIVGKVEESEKNVILTLFEKRNALENLLLIKEQMGEAEIKSVEKDYQAVNKEFDDWWIAMAKKYVWEGEERKRWIIDFMTCEVFLVD